MSNASIVNKDDDVSSGDHSQSTLPQQVTVIQAADIPKASPEALNLLKLIGKQYNILCSSYFARLLLAKSKSCERSSQLMYKNLLTLLTNCWHQIWMITGALITRQLNIGNPFHQEPSSSGTLPNAITSAASVSSFRSQLTTLIMSLVHVLSTVLWYPLEFGNYCPDPEQYLIGTAKNIIMACFRVFVRCFSAKVPTVHNHVCSGDLYRVALEIWNQICFTS